MGRKRKIILAVIDGLGDEPIPQFGFKTPLEEARTPVFDDWMAGGVCGLVQPYFKKSGLPTSEDSHLALLGYNPETESPGRGVLEALGLGIELKENEVCLRGNFAALNQEGKIINRRAERIENTLELIEAVSGFKFGGVEVEVFKGLVHRVVLKLKGEVSASITDGDNKELNIKPLIIQPKDDSPAAKNTAMVLNEFLKWSSGILKKHPVNLQRQFEGKLPANFILLRGSGQMKKVQGFKERFGLNSLCVAGAPLYKGIGKFLGMELIKIDGATGLANTNIEGKFSAALGGLSKFDFVFLHIKAADSFAEDGDFEGKKKFIEKIDGAAGILNEAPAGTLIAVTGDHATCSLKAGHCLNDVPLLICVRSDSKNTAEKFGESFCQKGKLGKILQTDFMKTILEYED